MITKEIPLLDLRQIADSGQCFRMEEIPRSAFPAAVRQAFFPPQSPRCSPPPDKDGRLLREPSGWRVAGSAGYLEIYQSQNRFLLDCPESQLPCWSFYFDLQTDYAAILNSIDPADQYLDYAARFGQGIRILNQDPWEMILTFIISQQKTIPNIRELVQTLCVRYGQKQEAVCESGVRTYHTFPTPRELAGASLRDLQDLKLGYRAKYIHQVCQDAAAGRLDLLCLKTMGYREAMDYLCGFYGIGKKVANCICLFGLHHIEAFPVDTWIQKILLRQYYRTAYDKLPKSSICDAIVRDQFGRYRDYGGVIQQYIFYYERFQKRANGSGGLR